MKIHHYILKKELPLVPVGTRVFFRTSDYVSAFYVEGFEEYYRLPPNIDVAEWLIPITWEEFRKGFERNTIEYFMSLGKSEEKAKELLAEMFE